MRFHRSAWQRPNQAPITLLSVWDSKWSSLPHVKFVFKNTVGVAHASSGVVRMCRCVCRVWALWEHVGCNILNCLALTLQAVNILLTPPCVWVAGTSRMLRIQEISATWHKVGSKSGSCRTQSCTHLAPHAAWFEHLHASNP